MGSAEKLSGFLSSHGGHLIALLLTILKFPVAISSFFPTLSSADTAFSAVCEDDLPRLANKCGMRL